MSIALAGAPTVRATRPARVRHVPARGVTTSWSPTASPTLTTPTTAAPAPALRLTRRGRLVRSLVLALAVVLAVALGTGAMSGATGAVPVVTVESGQTLSHVAAEHLPDVPTTRGVFLIQQANDLNSAEVRPGQELVIPQVP